jgi:hypothetical protein
LTGVAVALISAGVAQAPVGAAAVSFAPWQNNPRAALLVMIDFVSVFIFFPLFKGLIY